MSRLLIAFALARLCLPEAKSIEPKTCTDEETCTSNLLQKVQSAGFTAIDGDLEEDARRDQAPIVGLEALVTAEITPSEVMEKHCPRQIKKTSHMTKSLYLEISGKVKSTLTSLPEVCNVSTCPRADWAGCVLRMAGHDFMDYVQPGEGGSDACTDFSDPDNKGLRECLADGEFGVSVGTVYSDYCSKVSLADMIVIAAEAVIEQTRQWHVEAHANDESTKYSQSKPVSFADSFRFGRETKGKGVCQFRPHLLPNPVHGCDDVKRNFVDLMGMTLEQTTVISGVHTLGRARPENSGYDGWWSDPLNSRRFNNNYFVSILHKGWMPEALPSGKTQWRVSDLSRTADVEHEMMLTSDLCLLHGSGMFHVEKSPYQPLTHDAHCCAWAENKVQFYGTGGSGKKYNHGMHCGSAPRSLGNPQRVQCCDGKKAGQVEDCGFPIDPMGLAIEAVVQYAGDDNKFIDDFKKAWVLATEIGQVDLKELEGDSKVAGNPVTTTTTTLITGGLEESRLADFTPSDAMALHCPDQISTTPSMTRALYVNISSQVKTVLSSLPEECNQKVCPRADWSGCVLRMAGHDFMDYAPGEGGSDACTDFTDPDNAGLKECLAEGEFNVSVGTVYANFCNVVSLADMIVIAAEAVIEQTRQWHIDAWANSTSLYSTSVPISFADKFKFGRTTKAKGECQFRPHMLPNPVHGCDDVQRNFVKFMGLTKRQTTALLGVHTLGRARAENSGFEGWWSDPVNSRRFNNNYYVSMAFKGWMPKHMPSGKMQWFMSNLNREKDNQEMMLTSDLCLFFGASKYRPEPERPPYTPLRHSHNCCAWVEQRIRKWYQRDNARYNDGLVCGELDKSMGNPQRRVCCDGKKGTSIDCGFPLDIQGWATHDVLDFAYDDNVFVKEFVDVWVLATELGHENLKPLM